MQRRCADFFFLVASSVDLLIDCLFRVMTGQAGQIVLELDASQPAPAGSGGGRQESYVPMGQRWRDNWCGSNHCCVISNAACVVVMSQFPVLCILGLYWGNGKEHGNYYSILGLRFTMLLQEEQHLRSFG